MALVTHRRTAWNQLSASRGMLGLGACLMIGGCAQLPIPGGPDPLTLSEANPTDKPGGPGAPQTRSELEKATQYWGKKYSESPNDIKNALNFGRNLRAMGEKERALAVFQQASMFHGDNRELAGDYGRLALEFDQVQLADRLLAAADDSMHPDWRIISARGTVLAKQGKYAEAIPFYNRALSLAHDQPSILSNLALATAMSGDPARAESLLRRAETSDGTSPKIRQNLALVLGLQGKYDEAKLIAARDIPMETAAENTSFLRQVVKLEPKTMPSTVDKSIDVAEAPVAQSKPSRATSAKAAQVASAADANGKKTVAAKPAKPETAPVTEPAPAAPLWTADLKQAAAAPASLPWSTDLKQAEAPPAPAPVSASADEAKMWTANISAHGKKAKAEAKGAAAGEVTHRDIDLSLRAPAKSEPGPAKKTDTDAILPPGKVATVQSWTPVASSADPASK